MGEIRIRGNWVHGELNLSVNTIKQILTTDLVSNLEEMAAGRSNLSSTDYIKDLIGRLEKLN